MENDPEQYKKFIGEQLKEGEKIMAAPEPMFCLRCNLEGVSRIFYSFKFRLSTTGPSFHPNG